MKTYLQHFTNERYFLSLCHMLYGHAHVEQMLHKSHRLFPSPCSQQTHLHSHQSEVTLALKMSIQMLEPNQVHTTNINIF